MVPAAAKAVEVERDKDPGRTRVEDRLEVKVGPADTLIWLAVPLIDPVVGAPAVPTTIWPVLRFRDIRGDVELVPDITKELGVKDVAPVPPLATDRVPARVTAPVVAVFGVNPVVPALNDNTPLLVIWTSFAFCVRVIPLPLVNDLKLSVAPDLAEKS